MAIRYIIRLKENVKILRLPDARHTATDVMMKPSRRSPRVNRK